MHGVRIAPVAYISAALALGIAGSDLYEFAAVAKILAAIACACLCVIALARQGRFGNKATEWRRVSSTILFLILVAAAGAASWRLSAQSVQELRPTVESLAARRALVQVDGLIIDEPKIFSGNGTAPRGQVYRFLVSVKSSGPLGGRRLAVTLKQKPGDKAPRWGELWRLRGRAGEVDIPENPGFERHLFHRKVIALFKVGEEDGAMLAASHGAGVKLARRVRDFAAHQAERYLPADELALLMGVSLGDGSYLTEDLAGKFRITGLSHMVVASGMNIAVVVACILFPLIALSAPRFVRVGLGSAAAISYVLIAGAQPSVTRAGVMAVMALTLSLFFRRADLISLIATSALLLLALDPFSLFDLSFQLSYAATIGLAFLLPLAGRVVSPFVRLWPGRRGRTWLQEALQVTLAAQLAVFPIILHNFGTLSPYTLPANIAAVPVATFVLVAGLVAPIAGAIWYPLGILVYAPLNASLGYLIAVAGFFASLPAAGAAIEPLSGAAAVALSALIFALGYAAVRKISLPRLVLRRRWLLAAAVMMLLALLIRGAAADSGDPDKLQVTFLDVGQGDSAVARAPGGATVVFDTGAPGHSVLSKLRQVGVRRIDLLVISHFELDHAGEAAQIIRRFPTGTVLAPPPTEGAVPLRLEVERAMQEKGVRFIPAARGEVVKLGRSGTGPGDIVAKIEIITPLTPPRINASSGLPVKIENLNDGSVVARLSYGRNSFLFMGDLETRGQQEIVLAQADVAASVLKVPHHGSRDAAEESFMQKVRPAISVLNVGCRNSYHHPHTESLQLLDRLGGTVYRTDHDGPIEVIGDGINIQVRAKGSAHPCR